MAIAALFPEAVEPPLLAPLEAFVQQELSRDPEVSDAEPLLCN